MLFKTINCKLFSKKLVWIILKLMEQFFLKVHWLNLTMTLLNKEKKIIIKSKLKNQKNKNKKEQKNKMQE